MILLRGDEAQEQMQQRPTNFLLLYRPNHLPEPKRYRVSSQSCHVLET
jgi:hypothetical protein